MRPVPEGFLLRTTDGFLYAFLEDPAEISLVTVQRLLAEVGDRPARLVVLTSGRLPLALTAELTGHRATVVDGSRFRELATGLGLGAYLGEEPRPAASRAGTRQLPSARQLDDLVTRARTWLDWGVPALALRFYRQALDLKPEFVPARNGVGRSLLGLGLLPEAKRVFEEVRSAHPENIEARLGLAAVAGSSGDSAEELTAYRKLLDEDPNRVEVRAHLIAALLEAGRWPEAAPQIAAMLAQTPEDARLRFLHGVALERTGRRPEGERERRRARTLGLDFEAERSLCQHLGLPEPDRRPEVAPSAARAGVPQRRARSARRPGAPSPKGSRPDVRKKASSRRPEGRKARQRKDK